MDNTKLRISHLINYLKHPLQLKAERVFGKNIDDDEKLEQEYEAFGLDGLKNWEVNNLIANEVLKKEALDKDCNIDHVVLDEIRKRCALFNILPRSTDDYKLDPIFNLLFNQCVDCMSTLFLMYLQIFGEKPTIKNILKLDGEIKFTDCVVQLDKNNILLKIDNNKLYFMEFKKIKVEYEIRDFYTLYVVSLLYVLLQNNATTYTVNLVKGESEKDRKIFEINSKTAKHFLDLIVRSIIDPIKYYQFIPVNSIESELKALGNYDLKTHKYIDANGKKLMNYYALFKETSKNKLSTWEYFKDASLFNNLNDLGYSSIENFEIEYANALTKYKELIEPLLPKDDEDAVESDTNDKKEEE